MKQKERVDPKLLAQKIIKCAWNTGIPTNRACTIFLNCDLLSFLRKEKESMGLSFKRKYGADLLEMVEQLYAQEAHPFSHIHEAIMKDPEFENFSIANFTDLTLINEDIRALLPSRNDDSIFYYFSRKANGDIRRFHNLNDTYLIIEVWLPESKLYYAVKNKCFDINLAYPTFEKAVIGLLFPFHEKAVAALHDHVPEL